MESLRAHTHQSYVAFSSIVAATVADPTLNGTLDDLHGRFKVWADNIGAFHEDESRASINYRLRNAPRMRDSVRSGLLRLENACERARTILSEHSQNHMHSDMAHAVVKPPPPTVDPRDNDETGDATGQREHEARLEQLLLSIKSTVNYLFGLSAIMRRDLPRGRLPDPSQFSTEEASFFITYVADKFPKLRDPASAWLARRLGNAIALRRHYIRYRQEHRQRLAVPPALGFDDSTTVATSFSETSIRNEAPAGLSSLRARSVVSAATSFISTRNGELIPNLDSLFLEGVQLRYGEAIECPYCRTVQTVENERDWHRHVFDDLQPYVCIAEGCTSQPFTTMRAWMKHDLDAHTDERAQSIWRCPVCSPGMIPFSSCESLEEHLGSHHLATANQAAILANGNKAQVASTNQRAVCPFCTEFDGTPTGASSAESLTTTSRVAIKGSRDYYRHVASHQQELALRSIPLIDGLEVEEDPDESSVVDDDPPTPSQPPFFGHDVTDALNTAVRDDSASLYSKSDIQAVAQAKLLTCDECGREFDTPHRLNHHKKYHWRPHICDFPNCGKRFGTKTHLNRHINDKHVINRKYYCTDLSCVYSRAGTKSFPRKDNLRRHMLKIHNIEHNPMSDPDE